MNRLAIFARWPEPGAVKTRLSPALPAPALFESIPWGTSSVLEQTLERARRSGLETGLMGGLADLDTPDDLVRFAARRALAHDAIGRHTAAALRLIGLLPRSG